MNYLIDTCVVSELVRPKPNQAVFGWFKGRPSASSYLSVLTLGEIEKGIERLDDGPKRSRLRKWADTELRQTFFGRILPVTEDVMMAWAQLQVRAERRGVAMPVVDGILAATAIVHQLTVLTRDVQTFDANDIPFENPWDA